MRGYGPLRAVLVLAAVLNPAVVAAGAQYRRHIYPGDLSDTVRRSVSLKLQLIEKRLAEKA
jgi:hypothetical protein